MLGGCFCFARPWIISQGICFLAFAGLLRYSGSASAASAAFCTASFGAPSASAIQSIAPTFKSRLYVFLALLFIFCGYRIRRRVLVALCTSQACALFGYPTKRHFLDRVHYRRLRLLVGVRLVF